MRLEEKIAESLILQNKTLATAESCTGGLLAHRLTNVSGSSKFFKCGLITYSNESKISCLRISSALIKKHGAVSQQVAISMARKVREIHKTDFGIGITGIAGPLGATRNKPVGLTFIAISTKIEIICIKYHLKGHRVQIKQQAVNEALKMLNDFLI